MPIVKRIASEEYTDEKALYEANKVVENIPQADWNQNDETALDFIKNKPDIATDEDVMGMLSELGMVNPVTTSDGSILTSPTGEIYSL